MRITLESGSDMLITPSGRSGAVNDLLLLFSTRPFVPAPFCANAHGSRPAADSRGDGPPHPLTASINRSSRSRHRPRLAPCGHPSRGARPLAATRSVRPPQPPTAHHLSLQIHLHSSGSGSGSSLTAALKRGLGFGQASSGGPLMPARRASAARRARRQLIPARPPEPLVLPAVGPLGLAQDISASRSYSSVRDPSTRSP